MREQKSENRVQARSCLETIDLDRELDRVCGGVADPGQCFDSVAGWAAGGALAGSAGGPKGAALGALGGGGAAYLTTPACGDGTRAPLTMMRESLSRPSQGGGEPQGVPSMGEWGVP